MAEDSGSLKRMCPHCGNTNAVRLGLCAVCERIVCDRCGNTQYTSSGRKVYHEECFRKSGGGGFSMIKIIK